MQYYTEEESPSYLKGRVILRGMHKNPRSFTVIVPRKARRYCRARPQTPRSEGVDDYFMWRCIKNMVNVKIYRKCCLTRCTLPLVKRSKCKAVSVVYGCRRKPDIAFGKMPALSNIQDRRRCAFFTSGFSDKTLDKLGGMRLAHESGSPVGGQQLHPRYTMKLVCRQCAIFFQISREVMGRMVPSGFCNA